MLSGLRGHQVGSFTLMVTAVVLHVPLKRLLEIFCRISGKTSAIYQSQYRPKTTKLQYVAYVFLGIF